jgi:putative CocE/NonD family hydrolase
MRDGIKLNATVYRPAGQEGRLPVLITLTHYIADSYHDRAMYFARNGYVFALVDCRGRGNSEGVFRSNEQEAKDGFDTVEWLARQPWSDGQVAMWGGSYAGDDQWATLKEFPPHLKTIVPAAAAFAAVDFPFWRNIWYAFDVQWFTYVAGVTGNANLFQDSSFWIDKFRRLYLNHLPFVQLDTLAGGPSAGFQEWLKHPIPDAYWDAMVPTDADFAKVDLPILTITGHYDDDQPGAMEYYRRHMRLGSSPARDKHYLLMGPWDHSGTRTPRKEVGGLTFGDASLVDLNAIHKAWYDWIMKGGPKPEFLKKRVTYYVAGAEEWRYADTLEEVTASMKALYLSSREGQANDVYHSGTLGDVAPQDSSPDRYTYDPLDTRPAELEREEIKNWITDTRYALNLFGNGLVYHSEPLAEATDLCGYVRFVAWMSLDVPDTDFRVDLYEIKSDGTSLRLTQDLMRARYRESLRQERHVRPGVVERYEFSGFPLLLQAHRQGKQAAPCADLPQLHFPPEKLQRWGCGGAGVGEGRAYGPRDALPRCLAPELPGDPHRALNGNSPRNVA